MAHRHLMHSITRLYLAARYEDGNVTYTSIYYCVFENNQWLAPQKLNGNVNADGYNAIQPFVQADGKRLYFASDKPGGMGGYDIWVSNLDSDGNAVDATNLGKTINTASDERAPFYDALHQRLMFSSTGFTGPGRVLISFQAMRLMANGLPRLIWATQSIHPKMTCIILPILMTIINFISVLTANQPAA